MLIELDFCAYYPLNDEVPGPSRTPDLDAIIILDIPAAFIARDRIGVAKDVGVIILEALKENSRLAVFTSMKGLEKDRIVVPMTETTTDNKKYILDCLSGVRFDLPAYETDFMAAIIQAIDLLDSSPMERKVDLDRPRNMQALTVSRRKFSLFQMDCKL